MYSFMKGGSMDQIWNAIGQYAFPIVMCCVMSYYVKYVEDKHREEIADLNRDHKEEMNSITEALNNNTLALQHLTDYMEANHD